MRYALAVFTVLLLSACAVAQETPEPRASFQQIGTIADARIDESSGLARSFADPGMFWTHNDSGDVPRIFLIDRTGQTIATVNVEGALATDWEDMASFKRDGESYLLIGDVGDNSAERERCTLYVVPEPHIDPEDGPPVYAARPLTTISFVYEDGPHDCESVAVDPTGGKIYLVSKVRRGDCTVYELPLPTERGAVFSKAKAIARLEIINATAMDISSDGMRAVVLTYKNAYEFVRADGETWAQAFSSGGRLLPMPKRRQGESICYGDDDRTLYLTSEHKAQTIWEVSPVSH